MPELPEAETVARALDRAMKQRKIVKVEIFVPKLRTPLSLLCAAGLEGQRIVGCRRRARYVVADLADGRTLVFHLGMSGSVRVEEKTAARRKHDHVELTLDDGRALRFNDPRRFGSLEVQPCGADGWPESLAHIGVEPLSDAFTGETLFKASRGRRLSVKGLIMDNAVVTGIGNIYAAETLFACGIRPQRMAFRLTRVQCDALAREAKRILALAIAWGGTTVHDFRHVDGTEGQFVQQLKIYGQSVCPVCGTRTAKVVLGGRTSWYCPACQK
ncbi:MAG: bifunctional DNA-formamidopyrimidine glycosylase/DNA-(apurinic or apyrimidinic site) lyase [Kiritimatiellia bacterium]